ncbi:MAG TPA: GNAT family N-acetyltransferase [Solirubrobacteraceae bacterium]|nr:GNAT family N-acetyltransferase [Solirubrobacteraceae bacterium]
MERAELLQDATAIGAVPEGAPRLVIANPGTRRAVALSAAAPHELDDIRRRAIEDPARASGRVRSLGRIVERALVHDSDAAVLLVGRSGAGRIVALGGYATADGESLTVVEVDVRYQSRGVGTLILRTLADAARAQGLAELVVEVPVGAPELRDVLRDCGIAGDWELGFPLTRVRLRLDRPSERWSTPGCRLVGDPLALAWQPRRRADQGAAPTPGRS